MNNNNNNNEFVSNNTDDDQNLHGGTGGPYVITYNQIRQPTFLHYFLFEYRALWNEIWSRSTFT